MTQEVAVLYVRKSTVCPTAIRYVRQLQMIVRRLKLDFMKFGQLVQEKKKKHSNNYHTYGGKDNVCLLIKL